MIHPGHEWTSLSVQVDSLAGPHRDYQNFGLNLVVGVSLFEQGQIWMEHEGGRYFEEVGTSRAGSSPACQRQRCPLRCSPLLACSQTMVWWKSDYIDCLLYRSTLQLDGGAPCATFDLRLFPPGLLPDIAGSSQLLL